MVTSRDDIVGLDCSILMHPRVWEASGHVAGFTDPLVDCKECKQPLPRRPRSTEPSKCPECGGELTEARQFNLMFKTFMGPVEDTASVVYLRPETAQGIFVNFQNVLNASRQKLPFGIAQIGKSFRNEITPGNFLFRTREFEQMEIEFFVKPGEDEQWYEYWKQERFDWYLKLRHRARRACACASTARTSSRTTPRAAPTSSTSSRSAGRELEGIANRTDFDLKQHAEFSGKDLSYFDEETRERFVPVRDRAGGRRRPRRCSRSSSTPTTRTSPRARSASCCASIRGSRRSRRRSSRCCGRRAIPRRRRRSATC